MTAGELIDLLSEFDDEEEVFRTAGEDPKANVKVSGVQLRKTYVRDAVRHKEAVKLVIF